MAFKALSKPLGELSTREKTFSPPIKEIILENFMSYEYARIPLNQGQNLIVGPNGLRQSLHLEKTLGGWKMATAV